MLETGGVSLNPGGAYVFIASTAELPGSVGVSTIKVNLASDHVSSGIYFQQNGADLGQILTPNWNYCGESTAYHAVFSGVGTSVVPEPTGAFLLAFGLGIAGQVGRVCRRRRLVSPQSTAGIAGHAGPRFRIQDRSAGASLAQGCGAGWDRDETEDFLSADDAEGRQILTTEDTEYTEKGNILKLWIC